MTPTLYENSCGERIIWGFFFAALIIMVVFPVMLIIATGGVPVDANTIEKYPSCNIYYTNSKLTGDGYGWSVFANSPIIKIEELDYILNKCNISTGEEYFTGKDLTDADIIGFIKIYSYYTGEPVSTILIHDAGYATQNETYITWPWAAHCSGCD